MNTLVRTILISTATFVTIAAPCVEARAAAAPTTWEETVTPRALTQNLVPKQVVAGDREFNGNGPKVNASLKLRTEKNGTELWAEIKLNARETKADWSETKGTWQKKIWSAPSGKKIASIASPRESKVTFESEPAGFQFIAPSDDMQKFAMACLEIAKVVIVLYEELEGQNADSRRAKEITEQLKRLASDMEHGGNHIHIVPPPSAGPVAQFSIVGDTGGPDISHDDNGKDDTRIERIDFAPIRLNMTNR